MNLSLFLRLGRVSNLPTVWSNVIAGALLAGARMNLNSLVLLCVTFSAFYIGGMFLNDAFDAEYDTQSRPERPIPRGEVQRTTVYAMGFVLLVLGIMMVALHGILFENQVRTEPVLYAFSLAVCIVWYNADHKQNFVGPMLMGLSRVYVYTTTAFAVTESPGPLLWYGAVALLSYLIGLTYIAQQENRLQFRNIGLVGFLLIPLGYPLAATVNAQAEPHWLVTIGLSAFILALIARAVLLLRFGGPVPLIKPAVVSLIAGISLVDGLAAGVVGEPYWALAGAAGFVLCLAAQKWVPGT